MAKRLKTKLTQSAKMAGQSTLPKIKTGIQGLDDITGGGLPRGRSTLICGGAGSGKTILSMQIILNGVTLFNEAGLFVAFEEREKDLVENFSTLGYDIKNLIKEKKLALENIFIEKNEMLETGDYNLDGFFIRLEQAVKNINAKRVVLDSLEGLFDGFGSQTILRGEIRRLLRWFKKKNLTIIITGESDGKGLTKKGIEEFVSDCVVSLDHRVDDQLSTRRLRVVKYRGTYHGTNEYPFLIDEHGIAIMPITSVKLQHKVTTERISSGIPRLDEMLEGKGYYVGSSILISGSAGTGKSSMAAHFSEAAAKKGKRVLYFGFEESADQIARNVSSIGIQLRRYIDSGRIKIRSQRPTVFGLEHNLTSMHKEVYEYKPDVIIIDPISSLTAIGSIAEVNSMLTRFIDYLKTEKITGLFTTLTHSGQRIQETEIGISSLIDTWILLRDHENHGETNKLLSIIKSRGMAHSNQVREFLFSNDGIRLEDIYLGPKGGFVTGAARIIQEARDEADMERQEKEIARLRKELTRKAEQFKIELKELEDQFNSEKEELKDLLSQEVKKKEILKAERERMILAKK